MIGFDPIFTQDDDPESNLEELEDDYNDIFDPFGSCKPNSEEAMTNRELHKLLQSLAVTGASTLTGFTQTECSTLTSLSSAAAAFLKDKLKVYIYYLSTYK